MNVKLRKIYMNTSINSRETKRAITNVGPTRCTQTQMPTWQ